jgi:DNA gyrase/topoisomerase IV subunit A
MERIVLSAMWALSFRAGEPMKKTSHLVAELRLADSSITASHVESTLARLMQPWSRCNPLVEVIGASCRLTPLADELFLDLADAEEFDPRFGFKVPRIVPVRVPLLLAKGTDGVPPHHLKELLGLAINVLQFGSQSRPELTSLFRGPDLPTGGVVPILPGEFYATGRGPIIVRGRMTWERDDESPRVRLIISELPPPVSASDVAASLAKLPAVVSASAEAHSEGERVLVELEHVAHARGLDELLSGGAVIGRAFDSELRINDGGHVMVADLNFVLHRFVHERRDVVKRRLTAELSKLQERAHVIEGLLVAADSVEPLLNVLRDAVDPSEDLWALEQVASPELKSRHAFAKQTPLSAETLRASAAAWIARVRAHEPRYPAETHSYDPGFSEKQARALLKTKKLGSIDRAALLREWSGLATELAELGMKAKERAAIDAIVHAQLVELRSRQWSERRTMEADRRR